MRSFLSLLSGAALSLTLLLSGCGQAEAQSKIPTDAPVVGFINLAAIDQDPAINAFADRLARMADEPDWRNMLQKELNTNNLDRSDFAGLLYFFLVDAEKGTGAALLETADGQVEKIYEQLAKQPGVSPVTLGEDSGILNADAQMTFFKLSDNLLLIAKKDNLAALAPAMQKTGSNPLLKDIAEGALIRVRATGAVLPKDQAAELEGLQNLEFVLQPGNDDVNFNLQMVFTTADQAVAKKNEIQAQSAMLVSLFAGEMPEIGAAFKKIQFATEDSTLDIRFDAIFATLNPLLDRMAQEKAQAQQVVPRQQQTGSR